MADTDDTAGEASEDSPTRAPGDAKRDILAEALEAFDLIQEAESDNRTAAEEDLRFARLSDQWPDAIRKQRELDGRPCLTINDLPAFIRQVVNDARQNKPAIKVQPVDSAADIRTADMMSGLIRNIETTSNADVAYDTAVEYAVSGGWGYIRVGLDYAYDDAFDLDIMINRVVNPFQIYGDPYSTAADSSDWDSAFAVEMVPRKKFEAQWKGAKAVDWSGDYADLKAPWIEDTTVMVAEWWRRDEIDRPIVKLSDGTVVDAAWLEEIDPDLGVPRFVLLAAKDIKPVGERVSKTHRVTQVIMTGAEVLEENDWPGRYIPIIPVYGEEIVVDGRRHLRSLIRDAKDPTRMENFWRSASTEMVALAPRVPFIGPKGAFKSDASKWASANRVSHAYLEYDGAIPPQRQPLDVGPAAGAMQEALSASNDKKRIMGLYDASLGARSNETSGRAILARQREGDVSTFHFIDNLSRAIRHTGRVIIDLIPHVYTDERIVRVLGEDGSQDSIKLGAPQPVKGPDGKPEMDDDGNPVMHVFDLTAGKYDLVVSAGPAFTTRREEAASQMIEMMRVYPAVTPVIGDLIAKNLDWPGAEEIAARLRPKDEGDMPEEAKKMLGQAKEMVDQLKSENEDLKSTKEADAKKQAVDEYKAETERLKLILPMLGPDQIQAIAAQTIMQAASPQDIGQAGQPQPDIGAILAALAAAQGGQGGPGGAMPPQAAPMGAGGPPGAMPQPMTPPDDQGAPPMPGAM